jgi:hypothetical protein
VLGQQYDHKPYSLYYISNNLAPTELNYTVNKNEFLPVSYSINKFRHYITEYPTFIHTNHSAIHYLINNPITNGRITRWLLLLQEFDITIIDKPGKDNVVVDFLSRLINEEEVMSVENNFLNEHFFSLSNHSPRYVDIYN